MKTIQLGDTWYTHHQGQFLYNTKLDDNIDNWSKVTSISMEEFEKLKKEFGDDHVKEVELGDVENVDKYVTYHFVVVARNQNE